MTTRPELIDTLAGAFYANDFCTGSWTRARNDARDEYLKLALTALEEAGFTQPQWRTIDSAPKDGTTFLACNNTSLARVMAISWFGKTSHVPLYGWCCGDDGNDIDLWEPTHWMPLPTPPASTDAKCS